MTVAGPRRSAPLVKRSTKNIFKPGMGPRGGLLPRPPRKGRPPINFGEIVKTRPGGFGPGQGLPSRPPRPDRPAIDFDRIPVKLPVEPGRPPHNLGGDWIRDMPQRPSDWIRDMPQRPMDPFYEQDDGMIPRMPQGGPAWQTQQPGFYDEPDDGMIPRMPPRRMQAPQRPWEGQLNQQALDFAQGGQRQGGLDFAQGGQRQGGLDPQVLALLQRMLGMGRGRPGGGNFGVS
jgi:hypothetical protein